MTCIQLLKKFFNSDLFYFNEESNGIDNNVFLIPELNFPFNSYEPYISGDIMELHVTKHHASYVQKTNELLKNDFNHIDTISTYDIFRFIKENISTEKNSLHNINFEDDKLNRLKNNFFGHINHAFLWYLMTPEVIEPSLTLISIVKQDFGSWEKFTKDIIKLSISICGSGWIWLVTDQKGKLSLVSTQNQDHVFLYNENLFPILAIDVWEHAYYLDYRNDRKEYINNFLCLVNWHNVQKLLKFALKPGNEEEKFVFCN